MALSRSGRQVALRLGRELLGYGQCGSGVSSTARVLSTASSSSNAPAAADPTPAGRTAWWAAAAALLGATGAAAAQADHPPPPHTQQSFHLLGMDQRRRAFFKYEKRIRELSAPEKVFEYFSTLGNNHVGFAMTPSDAMRSVVPVYPPYDSDIIRAGSLPGEPSPRVPQHSSPIVASFDIDASGGITFDEWLLFEALLSIPETDVEVAFALMDSDGNGSVDKQEFSNVLRAIQSRASKPSGTLRQGTAALHLASAQGGLVALFFGTDGKKTLSPAVFKKFLADLRDEMARLEFDWYDHRRAGAITARDFALSVVGCAKLKHVDEYFDKIDAMPEVLASQTVSYKEFKDFRGVWRRLRRLAVALEFWRHASGQDWTPADFVSVVQRVMGVQLAPAVVDVIFYLFDTTEGPGGLNTHFMLAVMDRHFETGPKFLGGKDSGAAAAGATKRSFFDCVSECSRKR